MNWIQRFLTAITTHKGDASAHHTPTVAGDLNLADLAEKAHGSLTGVTSDQHHPQAHTLGSHSTKAHNELTGVGPNDHHIPTPPGWTPTGDGGTKVAADDIEADAGILLDQLEVAVCSEAEAKGFVTKEFFVLPAQYYSGPLPLSDGNHVGLQVDAPGDQLRFEFLIPHDFTSLTSIELVVIAYSTETHRLNMNSMTAKAGEAKDTHSGSFTDLDTVMTDNLIYEIDISGGLSGSEAAGDYVGIFLIGDVTNTADMLVMGIKVKYS